MTPIFKLGPGVPIGSSGGFVAQGKQWMSWIHLDDIVGIFILAVDNAAAAGPMNGTAPSPCATPNLRERFPACCAQDSRPGGHFYRWGRRTRCSGCCSATSPV